MQYKALYRKLRPKNFSDIIGQDHIVKIILNQIKNNKVSHAYLFCGTRGTGKTSLAKVFAKAINCLNKIEFNPCNKCSSCLSINNNRSINVIEIDAASNNGVENIRNINEEVKYVPTEGFYKVYIIDEVHMLSIGAFNALLKTLEEPPEYIVFILATTEPQKIPLTINSRCQKFEFKRISIKDIVENIKLYLIKENINIEDNALRYIAKISDGSMRDALSIIDKCISLYYDEIITFDKVINIFGSSDKSIFFDLTNAILNYNSKKCIEIIDKLIMDGKDINQFVIDFILYLRNLLMILKVGKNTNLLELSQEEIDVLENQTKDIDYNILIKYIDSFSNLQLKFKLSSNHRILFEIECIKLCNPSIDKEEDSNINLKERILRLEKIIENRSFNIKKDIKNNVKIENNKEDIKNNVKIENNKEDIKNNVKIENYLEENKKGIEEDIKNIENLWCKFIDTFDNLTKNILKLCTICNLEGNLCIITKDKASKIILSNKKNLIEEHLINMFNKEYKILFIDKEEYNLKHKIIDNNQKNLQSYNSIIEKININIDIN